jgi:hypothetical protein
MTLGIVDNLTESFEFAKDGLVGHWGRWIILMVLLGISFGIEFVTELTDSLSSLFIVLISVLFIVSLITSLIASGYLVKVYKGGDIAPELEGYGEMFVTGIKLAIIQFIYVFIPVIIILAGIFFLGVGGLALLAGTAEEAAIAGAAIGAASGMIGLLLMLIGTVLTIALGLLSMIAGIRFAKTEKFGEGFNFEEIFATIKEIGWKHYILSYIVLIILISVISVILGVIPFIGWLLLVIILPLLLLWQGKFFEKLYSCA